ncbi:MAG TPA: adenosine-specific kinase [Patescibacteria group bacterium]|nr:adenosine-specific kinase [Patescibacteria group bacterium]
MEFKTVKIKKPEDVNLILGQSHFIKTVEDLYEALVGAVPGIKFGLAFAESSGACKVRSEGSDAGLKEMAEDNALAINCGHSFLVMLKDCYPINVLNAVKAIPEVCALYCASANPVEVVIAETEQGRGIMGVIDGSKTKGVESQDDINWRRGLLRKIGYKL